MSETQERTTLDDFGNGILVGLCEAGYLLLDEWHRTKLHDAFLEAFKVVEQELGPQTIAFQLKTPEPFSLSANVDHIIYGWRHGLYALREQPDKSCHMLYVTQDDAAKLIEHVAGGIDLYKRAATRLIEYLNTPYTPLESTA